MLRKREGIEAVLPWLEWLAKVGAIYGAVVAVATAQAVSPPNYGIT